MSFDFSPKLRELAAKAEEHAALRFQAIEQVSLENTSRVLAAFADVTGLSQEESNSSNCITTTCVQLRVGWILTGYRNRCRWVSTTVTTYMQRVGMNTCVTVLV